MTKPSLNPQPLPDGNWYYEDRRGIDVVVEHELRGDFRRGDRVSAIARITWGRLIKSMERCGYEVRKVQP